MLSLRRRRNVALDFIIDFNLNFNASVKITSKLEKLLNKGNKTKVNNLFRIFIFEQPGAKSFNRLFVYASLKVCFYM